MFKTNLDLEHMHKLPLLNKPDFFLVQLSTHKKLFSFTALARFLFPDYTVN